MIRIRIKGKYSWFSEKNQQILKKELFGIFFLSDLNFEL